MFGGPPMMPAPQYAPTVRPQPPAMRSAVPPPVPAAMATGAAAPQPAPPGPQPAQLSAPPRPIFRAQAAEEPPSRPAPLSLPPPEQLGVQVPSAASSGADWGMVHQRLERLGATCFLQEKMVNGGCRVTCLIPTSKPGEARRVEAQAGTVAEAARLALDEAEKWAGEK
jgi:hypothetical protein